MSSVIFPNEPSESPSKALNEIFHLLTMYCIKCGSHNSTALRPEDENEKLSAEDVPEELQLRDSSKKGDSVASSSAPSSSAPSSPSHNSSTSFAPSPQFINNSSTSTSQRSHSHTHPDLQIQDENPAPELLVPDLDDLPAENNTLPQHLNDGALFQPAPINLPVAAEGQPQDVRAILRDHVDIALSIIVLLTGLMIIYKLFLYL